MKCVLKYWTATSKRWIALSNQVNCASTFHSIAHSKIPNHASSMTGAVKRTEGYSSNVARMPGKKLQPVWRDTTMRMKSFKFAAFGVIRKLFNQIKLDEKQWDCQRIFWRGYDDEPMKEYWLTVVAFGLTSSAHLSVRCVMRLAKEAEECLHDAAKIFEKDFYMEHCGTGVVSEEKTMAQAKKVDGVLPSAGVRLWKWKSNSRKVLDAPIGDTPEEGSMVFVEEGSTYILGLKWMSARDKYIITTKTPLIHPPLTERKIVSCVAHCSIQMDVLALILRLGY